MTSGFTGSFFDLRNNISTKFISLIETTNLQKENSLLKEEVAFLNSKLSNYDLIIKENEILKKQLNILNVDNSKMLMATVVNDTSNIYSDRAILNVGSAHGVKVDNLVIYKNILVGKIIKVEETFSELEKINDINAVYPVTITGDTRQKGVLRGVLGQEKLKVTNVEKTSATPIGSFVMLAKDDYIFNFSDDILIGKVSNVVDNDHDVYKELEVLPMLDLSELDKVFILQ